MALNLGKVVVEHLKARSEHKFTARQLAEWVFLTYPTECQEKKENSTQSLHTDADLIYQIAAEIGSQRPRLQKKYPGLKTTEGRPRKYYFSDKTDSAEVDAVESCVMQMGSAADEIKTSEQDLYPIFSAYLWEEFGVYPKRIDERRSSNRRGPNGNRWLYPDLVAMEDLGSEWHREVKDCVTQYSDKRTKLWSFEVKLLINRSNVRECYFQAVSNSSWSNVGYLVASEIEGHETLKELRMLFGTHGIGLIRLDVEDPSESQVLIPAKEKPMVDWDTVNRLATENKDFLDYVKLVRQFYQTGEARPQDWGLPKEDK